MLPQSTRGAGKAGVRRRVPDSPHIYYAQISQEGDSCNVKSIHPGL